MKNKKTLIIPCAGKSTRFPNLPPKWSLLNSYNTSMLDMAMLPYTMQPCAQQVDEIIVTITKQQLVKNKLFEFLINNVRQPLSLCILENETFCAAETVYQTIQHYKITGDIIIKDSDCFADYALESNCSNYIVGLNVESNNEVRRLGAKSFIHKDNNNIITDIIEKKIVSSNICVGTYACNSLNFCENYLQLKNSPVFYKNEIYVSHVFSNMILTNTSVFLYVEASNFIDFGTLEDWEQNKNKLAVFDGATNNIRISRNDELL